jgi:hypothetical protein
MGNPASPVLADLTLAGLEYNYLTDPKNRTNAYKCKYVVRYIDDLFSTNNSQFKEIASEIYPLEIPLNFTELSDESVQFLDLEVKLPNRNIMTQDYDLRGNNLNFKCISIYDKTRDFNFQVRKFIHNESNVHDNLFTNVFTSQIIRYARNCNNRDSFKFNLKNLINGMRINLIRQDILYDAFFRLYESNFQIFRKFDVTTKFAAVYLLVSCL